MNRKKTCGNFAAMNLVKRGKFKETQVTRKQKSQQYMLAFQSLTWF
jgi:hypothetical protein